MSKMTIIVNILAVKSFSNSTNLFKNRISFSNKKNSIIAHLNASYVIIVDCGKYIYLDSNVLKERNETIKDFLGQIRHSIPFHMVETWKED